MKQYCRTCGAGTEYSLKKPKFCGSCGVSFSSISKSEAKTVFKTKSITRPAVAKIKVEEVEEEEERFEEPDIGKLDFVLEGPTALSSHKIEDIVGSHPEGLGDGYQREVDPSYSKETITQDFLNDAGSSRRNNVET